MTTFNELPEQENNLPSVKTLRDLIMKRCSIIQEREGYMVHCIQIQEAIGFRVNEDSVRYKIAEDIRLIKRELEVDVLPDSLIKGITENAVKVFSISQSITRLLEEKKIKNNFLKMDFYPWCILFIDMKNKTEIQYQIINALLEIAMEAEEIPVAGTTENNIITLEFPEEEEQK